jgi:anti-anti-sigma factor
MTINVEDHGGIKLVRLRGELRGEGSGQSDIDLIETVTDLLARPRAAIVLDLAGVSYMNSAGLGELVRLAAQANVQEARLVLASPSPYVAGVLEATKLDRFFETRHTAEEALQSLATPGGPA